MVAGTGIEPAAPDAKPGVLPLHHPAILLPVENLMEDPEDIITREIEPCDHTTGTGKTIL